MEIPLFVWVFIGVVVAFIATVSVSVVVIRSLLKDGSQLRSKIRSMSTKHGMMAEQFLPYYKDFPGDPQKFKFLGAPVDGILFEEDKIVIIEFKTGKSQLSATQRKIRKLIKEGKVYFKEIRMPAEV
jgi:predicted Holliday junction resolvase-like endonuclease